MDSSILERIVKDVGTPVYVYDESRLRRNFQVFYSAFRERYPKTKVLYAYKANTSLAVCSIFRKEGAGADVVSGGELEIAGKIGLSGDDIMFTSNAKTREELSLLQKTAAETGKKARISFRINPGIDPKTHPKLATGLKVSKFGLHMEEGIAFGAYRAAKGMREIEIVGIHTHIGSQIKEVSPYVDAAEKMMEFSYRLKKELSIQLRFVDLGGGLGVPYHEEQTAKPGDLAEAVVPVIKKWNQKLCYEPELWLEPGRYLVADAGILAATVQSMKQTPCRRFVNLDAGFNTLVRPAMYDAYHRIVVLGREEDGPVETYDVAGNVCESGDIFARGRALPEVREGDVLLILDAGAYGYSMASRYNGRMLPPEVLVRCDGSYEIIREKESMEDLYRHQRIPKDLL
jgi:diaminopimelate decarboxylase